jgi:hypothetical protein
VDILGSWVDISCTFWGGGWSFRGHFGEVGGHFVGQSGEVDRHFVDILWTFWGAVWTFGGHFGEVGGHFVGHSGEVGGHFVNILVRWVDISLTF